MLTIFQRTMLEQSAPGLGSGLVWCPVRMVPLLGTLSALSAAWRCRSCLAVAYERLLISYFLYGHRAYLCLQCAFLSHLWGLLPPPPLLNNTMTTRNLEKLEFKRGSELGIRGSSADGAVMAAYPWLLLLYKRNNRHHFN